MRSPYLRPSTMYGVTPTTRPSTGAYTGGAHQSADVEAARVQTDAARRSGTRPARAQPPPKSLWAEAREESLVRLAPDGLKRARPSPAASKPIA